MGIQVIGGIVYRSLLMRILAELPENITLFWTWLAKQGWHINWESPQELMRVGIEDPSKIDEFMIGHLRKSWEPLTQRILELQPLRSKILSRAFEHMENEDWISAIPLLFSQIDGIALNTFGVSIFYQRKSLEKKIRKRVPDPDTFLKIILDIMIVETPFEKTAEELNTSASLDGPSRHGVMHGREISLEYGTRENAYKTFSLLCFTVDCCNRASKA